MAKLPGIDDQEGTRVPEGLRVVDAHVHVFPDALFDAIRRWFDANAWPIRYRMPSASVVPFLLDRGVSRVVALVYAHKPGMATALNAFVAELVAQEPRVWGLGTVLPGEPGARAIVEQALGELGLRGIKLHVHVQGVGADDRRLDEVYDAAAAAGKPVLIHAGSGPSLAGYGSDVLGLCRPEAMEDALRRHPRTTFVVPHLGADHIDDYGRLLERYPNLYLDTTMALAGYLTEAPGAAWLERHGSRLLFGTDFPNIPYAWDRELRRLCAVGLAPATLEQILWRNATALFGGSGS